MNPAPIDYRSHDQQIWEEELADFVPQRIFDAHIHMFSRNLLSPEAQKECPLDDSDFATLQAWAARLYPGREVHYLILGFPMIGTDVTAHNRMITEQIRVDPLSRANRLVTPACTLEQIERDIKEQGFIGLKPYRVYSVTGDIHQCRIRDFLPEPQLELADEMGLWVTMHLSRHDGCGDEFNLDDLEEYTTKRYPRVKWILAHCARSFTYRPIQQGIERLRQMPNIWYDLSAVCDVRPFITLFQKEEPKRILYGSDGVDSTFFHGTYVALGRAWQYFHTDKYEQLQFPHCDGRPILAIYEELLAIKQAAEIAGLSRDDIEDIFWRNAVRDLGIDWPEV